jgi:2-C-methyl-D-erythritol 2,4-cyclodiphosphate synthase
MLGGVRVAYDRGLEGHSDGDCVIHAICDALLGAAAAGDMGCYFPSSDERWRGVASTVLLEETARLVAERAFEIENIDASIVAQAPALAPYAEEMRRVVSRALGIGVVDVSIKAKSADGLGALGRGDGIAALATALLRRKG